MEGKELRRVKPIFNSLNHLMAPSSPQLFRSNVAFFVKVSPLSRIDRQGRV